MDIVWDTPPDKGTRTSKWETVGAALKDNPGKWAKLYEDKDRNAHSLAGRLRPKFGSDFEVISRMTGTKDGVKQAGVWARYNPTTHPGGNIVNVLTMMDRGGGSGL